MKSAEKKSGLEVNETDNAVKSGTADESNISYTIVKDGDNIYPVKRET